MTAAADPAVGAPARRGFHARLLAGVLAAWAVVAGAAHVLHHVGPLAGAALLAGAGGTVVFFVLGLLLSLPLLRRIHRRFGSWVAPALAVAAFAAVFTVSSVAIAPRLTDESTPATPTERPSHADHHGGGGANSQMVGATNTPTATTAMSSVHSSPGYSIDTPAGYDDRERSVT